MKYLVVALVVVVSLGQAVPARAETFMSFFSLDLGGDASATLLETLGNNCFVQGAPSTSDLFNLKKSYYQAFKLLLGVKLPEEIERLAGLNESFSPGKINPGFQLSFCINF